jgi:hypothetical protein
VKRLTDSGVLEQDREIDAALGGLLVERRLDL